MHPGNPFSKYEVQGSYARLAKIYPGVASVCFDKQHGEDQPSGGKEAGLVRIDWQNPSAAYELSRALLAEEFSLRWELPLKGERHLVPGVPRTANYLCWIQDLLAAERGLSLLQAADATLGLQDFQSVLGADIGTGASCIFGLIGVRMCRACKFICTDIDPDSLEHAQRLVSENRLQTRVELALAKKGQYISFLGEVLQQRGLTEKLSFTVCNPPFFETYEDGKGVEERRIFAGTDNEKSFSSKDGGGGELLFFKEMFQDSLDAWQAPASSVAHPGCWFSCMFGRKPCRDLAREFARTHQSTKVSGLLSTALVQGKRTRWCLAWCLGNVQQETEGIACTSHLARLCPPIKPVKPQVRPFSYRFDLDDVDVDTAWHRVVEHFANEQRRRTVFDFTLRGKLVLISPGKNIANLDEITSLAKQSHGFRCLIELESDADGKAAHVLVFYLEIKQNMVIASETLQLNQSVNVSAQANNLMQSLEQDVKQSNRKWKRRKLQQETRGT